MKKEADRRGAELAPISLTDGMSAGIGVVSMSRCWSNLKIASKLAKRTKFELPTVAPGANRASQGSDGAAETYWGLRVDIVAVCGGCRGGLMGVKLMGCRDDVGRSEV